MWSVELLRGLKSANVLILLLLPLLRQQYGVEVGRLHCQRIVPPSLHGLVGGWQLHGNVVLLLPCLQLSWGWSVNRCLKLFDLVSIEYGVV